MAIVVIGSSFMDIKGYPYSDYVEDGRNSGFVARSQGGVARNVAEDIANVGLAPTFVSLLDHSGDSIQILDHLRQVGANTEYVRKTEDGLGMWIAVYAKKDSPTSISKRPDLLPIGDILSEQGDEIFENADSIVVEFDIEQEVLDIILALAKKYHKEVYGVISNIDIALQHRDYLKKLDCFVCNQQEAGTLFDLDLRDLEPQHVQEIAENRIRQDNELRRLVITMGDRGAVYVTREGESGVVPVRKVEVKDPTGAGDAFFSGVAIGLTYGKMLREACEIGTCLAASAISTTKNVCSFFRPSDFCL